MIELPRLLAILQILAVGYLAQNCIDSRLRPGSCTTLTACPHIIEEFYSDATSNSYRVDFQTFVSESICGFDGVNFLICCGNNLSPIQRPARYQTIAAVLATTSRPYGLSGESIFHFAPLALGSGGLQSPTIPPTDSRPLFGNTPYTAPSIQPNRPLPTGASSLWTVPLPGKPSGATSCGISRGTTNRVVGGAEAKRGAYPWMAALGYRDDFSANLKFLCAGSLVSVNYIVTSAHCITPGLLLVRLGAHDLSKPTEPGAVDLRIRRSVVHESFSLKSIANDIAVIELSAAAPMTETIGAICLPEGFTFLSQDFVGMNPFVAGWGAVRHQGPTSNVLRDVQVPIVSRQSCEQSYRSIFKFVDFSDKLICAGNSNVDACQGDSGGPLMLPQLDAGNYRYYLLGIVSYGYECARTGFPGVYTRVASYIPWIKRQII